jgi:predicted nucleotidyltransferase
MKENLINLSGKIDSQRLYAIETIANVANSLDIPFFIIGASARDLILSNGYDIATIRATLDIDFGVRVPNWDQYEKLKQCLLDTDEFALTEESQRLKHQNKLFIDLIPFGPIAGKDSIIKWPPSQEIVMHTLGFEESFRNAQSVRLRSNPVLDVRIVTLAGLALMKIISWRDKYPERSQDATDLALIIQKYTDAGNFERIFDELSDLLDSEDFDYIRAGARLLGRDIAKLFNLETKNKILEILHWETEEQDRYRLTEDMMKSDTEMIQDFKTMLDLLEELKAGILERS